MGARESERELPEAVIYVYDNNSSDGTAALAERVGAVVRHEYQQGKKRYNEDSKQTLIGGQVCGIQELS